MKQKLSPGARFFAPTPTKTFNVILILLLIAIVSGLFYLFSFESWAKYVCFLMIGVSAILQFQVDWMAYALDKFEPNGGILVEKKSDDSVFFENLDSLKEKMPDNIEHKHAMDEASKLVLYQPKRDKKTGRFIKKNV